MINFVWSLAQLPQAGEPVLGATHLVSQTAGYRGKQGARRGLVIDDQTNGRVVHRAPFRQRFLVD
jgi:hypothetical protein